MVMLLLLLLAIRNRFSVHYFSPSFQLSLLLSLHGRCSNFTFPTHFC